jgi:TonB family protein
MNNRSIYDELDQAIDQMMAAPAHAEIASDAAEETDVRELAELASELRDLPRENFKSRLMLELEWEAAGRAVTADAAQQKSGRRSQEILPSLFGKNWSGYPVRRSNFALSAALHALMVLAIGAGLVAVKSMGPQIDLHPSVSTRLVPYVFPVGTGETHGGGSGGAMDKLPASRGAAPRPARVQLTPPIILQTNMDPILPAESTVVAPDLISLKTRQAGDPLSLLARPSNGPGVHGGLGGHSGTGVGTGDGPGFGSGRNGGCCDGIYTPGNGVSMPRAIYAPEPEFSEEARRIKLQGEVTLLATIGIDGRPRNLIVQRALGMGLDEKALEAVHTWRFEPAKKDGHPVAVQMNIIVNFHLY